MWRRSHQPCRRSDLGSIPSPSSTLHLPTDAEVNIRVMGSWSLELPFPSARSTPQEPRNLRSKGQHKSGIDGNPDPTASGESAPPSGKSVTRDGEKASSAPWGSEWPRHRAEATHLSYRCSQQPARGRGWSRDDVLYPYSRPPQQIRNLAAVALFFPCPIYPYCPIF